MYQIEKNTFPSIKINYSFIPMFIQAIPYRTTEDAHSKSTQAWTWLATPGHTKTKVGPSKVSYLGEYLYAKKCKDMLVSQKRN